MKLNLVTARAGTGWVREGLKTFFRQPLAFTSLFFFFMAVVSIASQIPLVGGLLTLMLLPTMTLALMAATAQAAAGTEKPPAGSVFLAALRAVRADAQPLAVLGFIYALCFVAVLGLSALADGGAFTKVYLLGDPLTTEVAETTAFQVAVWISMALYLPLSLAFWHAPALVHWHQVPPVKSIFFSFIACLRNIGALTMFGLVWLGVFIGVGIGISLVAGLLIAIGSMGSGSAVAVVGNALMVGGAMVMAAMFFSSLWFSFRDSFSAE